MSLFDRIIGSLVGEVSRDASRYAFVDAEVGVKDEKVHDIGALRWDGAVMHSGDKRELMRFLEGV